MKKFQLIFIFLLFFKLGFGQDYLLKNEEVIFSFKTENGKKMVLAKDKENGYIIYRFGTDKKIELEYPEKNKESWDKFTFAYYSRGGGVKNAAMDLNNVLFKINNFEYSIQQNYYSESDEFQTGIFIRDLLKDKSSEIEGKYNSIKGTLYKFRDNKLLKIDKDRID